jgi:hypothetical protein
MLSKIQLFKKYKRNYKTHWPSDRLNAILKVLYTHQKICQWCGVVLTATKDMTKISLSAGTAAKTISKISNCHASGATMAEIRWEAV